MEQELASIEKFVLEAAGSPQPYYWNMPEGFAYPAIYFPVPEITSGGETFSTYNLLYRWYIVCFASTREDAYDLAFAALTSIRASRNLIPLVDEDGELTGKGLRLYDPTCKVIDDCAAQLAISFTSRRPYNRETVEKTVTFHTTITPKERNG